LSRPSGERRPIFTLPAMMMYSSSPGSPCANTVCAAEVDALQLIAQRGYRAGFDSLDDAGLAEDLVHR